MPIKDSTTDKRRLAKLAEIDVGGIAFGDIPIDQVTLDHCQHVMRRLPDSAKRPATRQQYAQVLGRVLALGDLPSSSQQEDTRRDGHRTKTDNAISPRQHSPFVQRLQR